MKQDTIDDQQAAHAAVMHYLDGTREASADRLKTGFYSNVNLHSVDGEGRLDMVALDRFVEFAGAGNLPPHTNEVLALAVIGDMAWAKVRFDLPDRDSLTYLRS